MITESTTQDFAARLERAEGELAAVLERHAQMQADPPRYSRGFARHCLADLLGRVMLSELQDKGDEVRPSLQHTLQQLEELIAPPPARTH